MERSEDFADAQLALYSLVTALHLSDSLVGEQTEVEAGEKKWGAKKREQQAVQV
jgi:hypothetical protein